MFSLRSNCKKLMRPPFSIFVVEEESMVPTFQQGDFVVTFNFAEPAVGEVVVFSHQRTLYLKRVTSIKSGQFYLSGDNKIKSATFGPIDKSNIVGKVIWKF